MNNREVERETRLQVLIFLVKMSGYSNDKSVEKKEKKRFITIFK